MALWQAILVFAKVIADLYRKGLEMNMKLAEVIKDVAFSTFIAFEAEEWDEVRHFTELGKKLTTAFMLISYPDIMITHSYDTIRNNKYVYQLFKSHPYTRALLEQYELRNGILEKPADIKQYYQAVAGENPFLRMLETLWDLVENIPHMFEKWGEVLVSLFHTKREDPFAFATHIISEYAKKAETVKLYQTPADIIEYYTSYAPYLIPTLTSFATIFGIYEDVIKAYTTFQCDKAVFLKMPAPYFYKGELLALGRPQSDFTIVWEIPYKKLFKGMPKDIRNKWINSIIIKDSYGNERIISCQELLSFIPLFQNLHYTDYEFNEELGILYINIDVEKMLKRLGIDPNNANLGAGAIICVEDECKHYDKSKWIDVLNTIATYLPETAYFEPYTTTLKFNLPGYPEWIEGQIYKPYGEWIPGTQDPKLIPFFYYYPPIGIFVKWCMPLDPERFSNVQYQIKNIVYNPQFPPDACQFSTTKYGIGIGVSFYDKEITDQTVVGAGLRIYEPEESGVWIDVNNQLPAIYQAGGNIERKADFITIRLFSYTFPTLTDNDLKGYIVKDPGEWTTAWYDKCKFYTWDELGVDYETFIDLYNFCKSIADWSYSPEA